MTCFHRPMVDEMVSVHEHLHTYCQNCQRRISARIKLNPDGGRPWWLVDWTIQEDPG